MLKEKVSEERYTDLNEEDVIIEDSKEEHWKDVYEDGENKSRIHALRSNVYKREK